MPPRAETGANSGAGWLRPTLAVLAAITALRIVALGLTPTDLFVDEAQYWLWGQDLAFGYYSKPPLIAWVIRAATTLGGSDAPFWVRLPGPLLHMATALVLGAIAARLWSARAAVWVALAYATLPMVALGSLVISTDTVMFPFAALALLFWLRGIAAPAVPLALAAGAALGLGMLAKYAAVYLVIGAGLAALFVPAARPRPWFALLALLALLATVAPNLMWNMANGFSTLEHTVDNADWLRDPGARAQLTLAGAAGFLGAQFGVFGPVLFAGLVGVVVAALLGRAGAPVPMLLAFALPALLVVTGQALISRAYANWAASAYLAGTVAVVPWLLMRGRRWLVMSFVVNGALCLALPLGAIFADRLTMGGAERLVFERYMGRADLSRQIIAAAGEAGLGTVVAQNRDILADLFYTGRDAGLTFRATPPRGRAAHHYALKFPLEQGLPGDVLFADVGRTAPACAPDAPILATLTPKRGAWRGKTITLFRVAAGCWGG